MDKQRAEEMLDNLVSEYFKSSTLKVTMGQAPPSENDIKELGEFTQYIRQNLK